jgi:hypothetical protein
MMLFSFIKNVIVNLNQRYDDSPKGEDKKRDGNQIDKLFHYVGGLTVQP